MTKEVASCIIPRTTEHGTEVLLLENIDKQWWELPGGKLENGETPEQCVIRETREELAVDIKILDDLDPIYYVDRGYSWKHHLFIARPVSGLVVPIAQESAVHSAAEYKDISRVGCGRVGLSPGVEHVSRLLVNNLLELRR